MTSEVLSKKIEFEVHRVAACFGVGELKPAHVSAKQDEPLFYEGRDASRFLICVDVCRKTNIITSIEVQKYRQCSAVFYSYPSKRWELMLRSSASKDVSAHQEVLARGLYRLGFLEESILAQLPQLNNHEKLELRLSLSRKYWPSRWLEEVKA